jgi:type II secretory pathway component GspD/PulD (secretin)
LDAVPVTDVVNLFSKISGANIIIAGNVSNVFVTANLKDVEWKAALGLALGSVNLSLIEDPSGILMVVTSEMYREKLQQIENTKPLVTKTFTIRYLNAVDFIEQVKQMKLLSPRGTIIASQSKDQERLSLKSSPLPTEIIQNPGITTEIILTDIKEYVDKIANLILLLDKREPQVFIEARIVDVVSDDSKKLGFDWEMLDRFGATLKMQDLKWTFSDEHSLINSTINRDDQADNRRNVDTLNKNYDINNIPYQTVTYEEQPPDSGNYVQVVTPTRTIADTIDRKHDISSVKTDTLTDTRKETKAGTALLSVSDASLFFSALQRLQNSEMISHPLIVVGNKVEAKIHVGERYPTIFSTKQAANPQTGQTESFSERVEWNDLGLTLWVIPEIDRQVDVVRLTVNPQMSTHVKDITTPAGSVYPVISTRQVSTRVNVPSKHTVVIGGLIDNQKGVKEKRVPILSDIPLLGLLFRHTEDTISKHNLLIMLTPTILDERAPLTGLEAVAQQSVDRLEKHPLTPKGNPSPKSGSVKTVTTPAAGLTGDQPTTPSTSSSLPGTTPPPAGLPAPGPGSETPAPPAGANPPSKAGPAQAPAPAN